MNRVLEVFEGFKRNRAMTLASTVLIFLTLFILGFALIVTTNTNKITSEISNSLQMHVYVKTDAKYEETEQLKAEIDQIPEVETTEISKKEEQLVNVTESLGDGGEVINDYFSGDKNPLNDVINVKVKDSTQLEQIKLEIESNENVESVDYGQEYGAQTLVDTMTKISIVAIISFIIFGLVTIFLIVNTIKLTITSRRKEIEIMRLVGAKKSYIITPFALEGALLGLIGGILSFIVVFYIYKNLILGDNTWMTSTFIVEKDIIVYLIFGQIIFGLIIGLISALVAIRNYLKI